MEKKVERSPLKLSESEKRKYLFLKQINILNAFRERNAISKEQYDISYNGLICLHFSLIDTANNLEKNYGELPQEGPYSLLNGGGGRGIVWDRK